MENSFLSLFSIMLMLAFSLVRAENNPFGFSNDQLSRIAKMQLSEKTPILNTLVNKATNDNWCCYGDNWHSGICMDPLCCYGHLQVANECIHIEDLLPSFLHILAELEYLEVIKICGGTETLPPVPTRPTPRPTTTTNLTESTTTTRKFPLPTTSNIVTTQSTSKSTTTPQIRTVYTCNFDFENCGGEFNSDQNFDISSLVRFDNHSVTDFSSVSKPTGSKQNGPFDKPVCQIPYNQSNSLRYFCSSDHQCLAGQPGDQSLNYCQKGNFLWASTRTGDKPFKKTLSLSSISLRTTGLHTLEFEAILDCKNIVCDAEIIVSLSANDFNTQLIINKNNMGDRKGWQKFDIKFFTEANSVQISIDFERKTQSDYEALFGLDEISILH